MKIPGSLPQICLISIFGIQAQEYIYIYILTSSLGDSYTMKFQTRCSGHIGQTLAGDVHLPMRCESASDGGRFLVVGGWACLHKPHWPPYSPGSNPKWVLMSMCFLRNAVSKSQAGDGQSLKAGNKQQFISSELVRVERLSFLAGCAELEPCKANAVPRGPCA